MVTGQFRKARYINPDKTRIDLELDHPVLGWIEMTISEEDYPEVWHQVLKTNPTFGKNLAEEYEANQSLIARNNMGISRVEFCIRLRRLGVIDQQWAVHAAQGNLPKTFFDAMKDGELDMSEDDVAVIWSGLNHVNRNHPFVEAIRVHKNLTPIQMDEFFK